RDRRTHEARPGASRITSHGRPGGRTSQGNPEIARREGTNEEGAHGRTPAWEVVSDDRICRFAAWRLHRRGRKRHVAGEVGAATIRFFYRPPRSDTDFAAEGINLAAPVPHD